MARRVNKWELIHAYFTMADNDQASKLRCPDDGMLYYIILDKDTSNPDPVLHCTYCQSNTRMGSNAWRQILEAVKAKYDIELEN